MANFNMTQLKQILDGLPENITVTFFATFARFEYSLLRCDYFRAGRGKIAWADWGKLENDLGVKFFNDVLKSGKASTLIDDPPKTLLVQNNSVAFGPSPEPVKDTKRLIKAAQQVRNNLFHGNKMYAADRGRDVRLLSEVLWVLDFVMIRLPQIRNAFDEPQQ